MKPSVTHVWDNLDEIIDQQAKRIKVLERGLNVKEIKMQFGIKKTKGININLIDIRAKLIKKDSRINHTELFIEVCYELASEHNLHAVISLDSDFILKKNNVDADKTLNVKFSKIV